MHLSGYLGRMILSLMAHVRDGRKTDAHLRKVRSENPTCVIGDCLIGEVRFGQYVTILHAASLENIMIDDFSYVSNNSRLSHARVGKFCSIGPYIQIGLGPHPTRLFVSTYPAFYAQRNSGCALPLRDDSIFDDSIPETLIGHDVWIGSNVIIPGGISIGTGAIIGAGAFVTKDVPPYAVVGGNPAKILRYRFSESEIEQLLKSAWWNWPVEKIRQHVDVFSDITAFLRTLEK